MARFSVRVVMLFILGCGAINLSDTAALSLEDKLKELESRLETKFILLEAKNAQHEEKVTQLETQLEQNVSLPFHFLEWSRMVPFLCYSMLVYSLTCVHSNSLL
jgi:hypothetical protein